MQFDYSRSIRTLKDAACFITAYATTAYFACVLHGTFTSALAAHLYLFIVSLVIWYSIASWQRRIAKRGAKAFSTHVLAAARVVLLWTLLTVFLAIIIHPSQLDPLEVLVFTGIIALLFMGRCLLRFGTEDLPRYGLNTFHPAIVDGGDADSYQYSMPEAALLNENTVRGSPL